MIRKSKTGGKRLLCWLLTAAMVMTGSSVPGLETKAASASDTVTQAAEREEQSESAESKESSLEAVSEEESKEEASEEESTTGETSTEETSEEHVSKEEDQEESSIEDASEQESETEVSSEEESSEKETEDKDEAELLGEGDYGTLVNGDFEDTNWNLEPWTLTAEGADEAKIKEESSGGNRYLNIWIGSSEKVDVSLIQTVNNVKGGNYKVVLKLQGDSGLDVNLDIVSEDKNLTDTINLGDYSDWNGWKDVSTAKFEITENANVTVKVSGSLSSNQTMKLDDIKLEFLPDTYEKSKLQILYDKYKDYKESDYTSDSWTAFESALTTASTILSDEGKTDENASEEITDAYEALEKAAEALVKQPINATMYYYVGETTDEVGVVAWNDGTVSYGGTATKADWTPWDGTDCYLMTKSEYPGWYSIDLVFANAEASSGFEIFTAAKGEDGTYAAGISKYKCNKSENNTDVYAKLVSKEENAYAVKGDKLYAGDDITTLQRNITLYVYDENGTAAIQSAGELSSVDETVGTVGKLTADTYTDESNSKFYSMKAVEGKANWYSLTFSVPTADTGKEVFRLDSKKTIDGTDEYTEVKKFINGGTADESSVNIIPAFTGNCYYKDGVLYTSIELAEGIKLGQLKDLVASDAVKAITEKGKEGYTEDTWKAFENALSAADTLIKSEKYATASDTTMADDITEAYTSLQNAVDGMEEAVSAITATLHYYVGDTTDEVGVVAWNDKVSYGTATKAEWGPWEGANCYLMTKSEYAGWYSIDISFDNEEAVADDKKGFEIYTAVKGEDGKYVSTQIYKCSQNWEGSDVYAKLVSKESSAYAVKGGKLYTDITAIERNITLYVYDKEGTPAIMSAKPISFADETAGTVSELKADYTDEWGNLHYDMIPDETAANWYYLTFSVPVAEQGSAVCKLYRKTDDGKYSWVKDFVNNATTNNWEVDITPVFSGNIYYKDGKFTDTKGKAAGLQELIAKAETYVEQDYTAESWAVFKEALENAKKIVALEEPTEEQIKTATEALEKAIKALKYARQADINVEKVALPDDFITGADLSSYISLIESGVVFKDENGNALSDAEFFEAIKNGGTNWVRIRIWDNPYDSSGNSYGGGHNDIETAIKIGKLATNAGMRVLIDFHYSDFWVDPSKYQAPKAWAKMSVDEKKEALYNHTYDNLVKLHNAGVDVGMVQVGNETNSGIAGVTYANEADICSLFSAGSKAVRDFSEKYCSDRKAVKVAVHFTDPQDGFSGVAAMFDRNSVDYDVFASSYYPYWHENATAEGDTSSLTDALDYVATTYGKQVMVAETSWATTWEDGDGHDNSAPKTSGQNLQYDISVQGQADEMRAVVAAVNSVTNGIGVFYWEPAWIPVDYAYNDDGTVNQEQLKKNQELWEKYGSGWASSYSAEYDPDDAGRWYGGSAIDNQAWFDFDGTALPTLNAYSYIRTGAACDTIKVSYVPKNTELEVSVGDSIEDKYPKTITAKLNNGTTMEFPVEWDENQRNLVSTDKTGEYIIDGIVTCRYHNNLKDVVEKYNVTLTIKVVAQTSSNQLVNPGFEEGSNGWTIKYRTKDEDGKEIESTTAPEGSDYTVQPTNENPYSGTYGMNFYRGDAGISIRVSQEITGLDAGNYDFGGFIQGGSSGEGDVSYAYVKVTPVNENGERLEDKSYTRKSKCELSGWLNWSQPEVSGFKVEKGDIVEVGFEINTSVAGSWGSIDDAYLYGSYGVTVDPALKNGSITVSDMVAKVGEKVHFVVIPDNGYVVDDADIYVYTTTTAEDGTKQKVKVENCGLSVSNGEGFFIMPAYPVGITADIKAIGEGSEQGIDIATMVKFENIHTQIYTGAAVTPEITAVYKTYTLVKGKDYTVEYTNNTSVTTDTSKAKAVITGKGSFTGTKELYFDIQKAVDLTSAIVTIQNNDFADSKGVPNFYYTGGKIIPDVTVTIKNADGAVKELEKNVDYVLACENNIKVGTAKLHIVANEKNAEYTGTITKTFKIVKADLKALYDAEKITVSKPSASVVYTGKAVQPNVTIKYGTMTLRKGTDYTVTYKNNKTVAYDAKGEVKSAGILTIKGKGNFAGQLPSYSFMVSPLSLSSSSVKATAASLVYTGQTLKPSITVKAGTTTLKPGRDYDIVRYSFEPYAYATEDQKAAAVTDEKVINNTVPIKAMGTYTLILKGKGNYKDEYTKDVVSFSVVDKGHSISKATVKVNPAVFTGEKVELKPFVKPIDGAAENTEWGIKVYFNKNTPLVYGTDYELVYEDNRKAGSKAKVTVKGIGAYAGEKTVNFKIAQADLSKLAEDSFSMDQVLDDIVGDTNYYTGYPLTPDFTVKANLESNDAMESVKSTVTLVKGNDYTITFKNNVSGKLKNGKYIATAVIKGKGNFKGKFEKEFEITPTTLNDFNISVEKAVYTGKNVKPVIKFKHIVTGTEFDLKAGTAYTVQYENAKNVANADAEKAPKVIIKEKGLNPGVSSRDKLTKKECFTITTATIDNASVGDIKVQSYKKGKDIKPSLTVKVNGTKLKLNKDYKVTYTDNRLRGEATVKITGIGNYSGTVTKSFTIK